MLMRILPTLIAAITAGILVPGLYQKIMVPAMGIHQDRPGLYINESTAKVFRQCALTMSDENEKHTAHIMNTWSPLWIQAQEETSNAEKLLLGNIRVCESLGYATVHDTPTEKEAFKEDLIETRNVMLNEIADIVLNEPHTAEGIAPLMGIEPSDAISYFKALKLAIVPKLSTGPTPAESFYLRM